MMDLSKIIGFEWDGGNLDKNWTKHRVSWQECEEIFSNSILLYHDVKHSYTEKRWYVLGVTNELRHLYLSFTIRERKIRIISARDMNKKERTQYE